jgi:hypothetical protein
MSNKDMQREQKITLGEMRANNGPRLLIFCCIDVNNCSHSVIISSELWPDHVRLSDLEPQVHLQGLRPAWRRCQASVSEIANGNRY